MAGKVQEKKAEKKIMQATENGFQIVEGDGRFVREGYAALEGEQKRMVENAERKKIRIDEKEV